MTKQAKKTRITITIKALTEHFRLKAEVTLPGWLLKTIALVIAHLIAVTVFGLDGADALLEALIAALQASG